MLIFDKFPHQFMAEDFATKVREKFRKQVIVCRTFEEFDKVECFPFHLDLPVVVVERDDSMAVERAIESSVKPFGGRFAGT